VSEIDMSPVGLRESRPGFAGMFPTHAVNGGFGHAFLRRSRAVAMLRSRAQKPCSVLGRSMRILVRCSDANPTERYVVEPASPPNDAGDEQLQPVASASLSQATCWTLSGMTLKELENFVSGMGEKPYRARQLYKWLYRPSVASQVDDMTDLGKLFREALASSARLHALSLREVREAQDGTRKLVYQVDGDSPGAVESVLIPASGRNTLCISSQLGCAMNCQFCFTGKMGLQRNLTAAEIVDQVTLTKARYESPRQASTQISNIVFMGMGEPFQNLDNVLRALEILLDPKAMGLSHRKVTVSTSGLVPEIRRYLRETSANLAVSLNATTNEVRNWIMPINRKYPLEVLLETLREEYARDARRGDKVFFEYVLLGGVNDSLDDAKRLLRLIAHIPCKVNLIPFNSHAGSEFRPSPLPQMEAFRQYLHERGVLVTLRRSRGDDKMAACGQLGNPGIGRTPPRMRVPDAFQKVLGTTPLQTRRSAGA
jgi:23S rRNA (adenine2503-C2)-methyltransferase